MHISHFILILGASTLIASTNAAIKIPKSGFKLRPKTTPRSPKIPHVPVVPHTAPVTNTASSLKHKDNLDKPVLTPGADPKNLVAGIGANTAEEPLSKVGTAPNGVVPPVDAKDTKILKSSSPRRNGTRRAKGKKKNRHTEQPSHTIEHGTERGLHTADAHSTQLERGLHAADGDSTHTKKSHHGTDVHAERSQPTEDANEEPDSSRHAGKNRVQHGIAGMGGERDMMDGDMGMGGDGMGGAVPSWKTSIMSGCSNPMAVFNCLMSKGTAGCQKSDPNCVKTMGVGSVGCVQEHCLGLAPAIMNDFNQDMANGGMDGGMGGGGMDGGMGGDMGGGGGMGGSGMDGGAAGGMDDGGAAGGMDDGSSASDPSAALGDGAAVPEGTASDKDDDLVVENTATVDAGSSDATVEDVALVGADVTSLDSSAALAEDTVTVEGETPVVEVAATGDAESSDATVEGVELVDTDVTPDSSAPLAEEAVPVEGATPVVEVAGAATVDAKSSDATVEGVEPVDTEAASDPSAASVDDVDVSFNETLSADESLNSTLSKDGTSSSTTIEGAEGVGNTTTVAIEERDLPIAEITVTTVFAEETH